MNKYKVKINGGKEFQLDTADFVIDKTKTGEQKFHLLMNNRSFNAEILQSDFETKTFTLNVNGNKYLVELKDRYDELLHKLGMDTQLSKKINELKAPMPGMVLKILVEEKQEIKKGDSVLILEAMKMENVIKSAGDGKIKTLKVKAGDKVEKGQVMVSFE